MKLYHALRILSGTITENGVDWYALGYEPWSFSGLGHPNWDDVKAKAAQTIADEFEELKDRIERLEKKLDSR